jgi:hypothetical protein
MYFAENGVFRRKPCISKKKRVFRKKTCISHKNNVFRKKNVYFKETTCTAQKKLIFNRKCAYFERLCVFRKLQVYFASNICISQRTHVFLMSAQKHLMVGLSVRVFLGVPRTFLVCFVPVSRRGWGRFELVLFPFPGVFAAILFYFFPFPGVFCGHF